MAENDKLNFQRTPVQMPNIGGSNQNGGGFDFSEFLSSPVPGSNQSDVTGNILDSYKSDTDTGFNWKNLFGGDDQKGYLIPGLQTLGGLANAYTGYKALQLSEDQFGFAKDQSNRDFASQAQNYNTELTDRQRARQSQTGGYNTSTPEGKAQFEKDLAAYVQANSIDPKSI